MPDHHGAATVSATPLLEVRNLTRDYVLRRTDGFARQKLRAVDDVSFSVARGEVLGIVGESGCGKSTLARIVMALDRPTAGDVLLEGTPCFSSAAANCGSGGAISRWCSRTLTARSIRAIR